VGMIQPERTREQREPAGIEVRIALYRDDAEPEIMEVSASGPQAATSKLTRIVMESVREAGGKVPEVAVREVLENLVHAGYRGVVISVLGGGSVRVSDRGPGVPNKDRAMEFGFSGASPEAAREIRGIGAGLGMARAAAEKVGGTLVLEDNIDGGTVATISVPVEGGSRAPEKAEPARPKRPLDGVPRLDISERQQKVLITVLECGEVGPSTVAEQLEISVSTAYRDLSVLEENGLVRTDEGGKRVISPLGRDLVEAIVNTWVR
jgi:DNA-binding transcriptional ArsR family regulator